MPYISKKDRADLLNGKPAATAGELNYLFSMICKRYLEDNGLCYQNINDIIGALEGAKLELYRRQVAEYEDTKIQTNGDI